MNCMNVVATYCPFCALQCGMHVATGTNPLNPVITVLADPKFPVNKGGLCVKGLGVGRNARASGAAADAVDPKQKRPTRGCNVGRCAC
jgi:molybdopterin-dependent oxidoreductase iron-sulfur protein